eukprot:29916-Pelagococcus_subviridis.AAC.15
MEEGESVAASSSAFYTLVPIRPRSRGERRSLRTLPGASLRPPLAFNPRPRRLSTPPDAFELHPDVLIARGGRRGGRRSAPRATAAEARGRARDRAGGGWRRAARGRGGARGDAPRVGTRARAGDARSIAPGPGSASNPASVPGMTPVGSGRISNSLAKLYIPCSLERVEDCRE